MNSKNCLKNSIPANKLPKNVILMLGRLNSFHIVLPPHDHETSTVPTVPVLYK